MSKTALTWIDSIIKSISSPYQVCGGLAAIAYGSKRALNDIDLFVPEKFYDIVLKKIETEVSKNSSRYVDSNEGWDVKYFQAIYDSVKIEVGSSKNVRIFDRENREWSELNIDFNASVPISIYGVCVPVIPLSKLIWYKRKIGRNVDLIDVEQISNV